MDTINSPYNIPDPEPIYAGSYSELYFKLFDAVINTHVDLTQVPNIEFTMCMYGEYTNPVLRFDAKQNTEFEPRIIIDKKDKSHMTVFIYPDDTVFFENTFYDFQISFLSHSKTEDSVIGQGKIRVFSKIEQMEE